MRVATEGKDHGLSAEELRNFRVIVLNIWRGILVTTPFNLPFLAIPGDVSDKMLGFDSRRAWIVTPYASWTQLHHRRT